MLLKFSIVVLTTVDSILKFPAMLPTQISCCLILARPLVTTYLKFFSHIVPCFWNDLPSEFCKLTIPPSSLPKSPTIICFGLLSLSPLRLATRDCKCHLFKNSHSNSSHPNSSDLLPSLSCP